MILCLSELVVRLTRITPQARTVHKWPPVRIYCCGENGVQASVVAREKLSFNTDARDVSIDSASRILCTERASISLMATNHSELPRRPKSRTDENFLSFQTLMDNRFLVPFVPSRLMKCLFNVALFARRHSLSSFPRRFSTV